VFLEVAGTITASVWVDDRDHHEVMISYHSPDMVCRSTGRRYTLFVQRISTGRFRCGGDY